MPRTSPDRIWSAAYFTRDNSGFSLLILTISARTGSLPADRTVVYSTVKAIIIRQDTSRCASSVSCSHGHPVEKYESHVRNCAQRPAPPSPHRGPPQCSGEGPTPGIRPPRTYRHG